MGCSCQYVKYKVFEINEKNNSEQQERMAHEIDQLEKDIHDGMFQSNVGHHYFTTGYNDILNYIRDRDDTVMVCQDNNQKIIAASYITQGQGFYTYNDLTKYFKFNKEFIEDGKTKYDPKELCSIEYDTYMKKIEGYKYAKERIAKELEIPDLDLVEHCKAEKEKGTFDEKDEVREKVNRYIYDYFRYNANDRIGLIELDRFYQLKFSDLQKCEDNGIKAKCENETEEKKRLYKKYDDLLDLFDLKEAILPDKDNIAPEKYNRYFDANLLNTIELDTYIVHPEYQHKRLATIVSFEGLKIQKDKLLNIRPDLSEIFICGTIHENNIPSIKVAEKFIKAARMVNNVECDTLFIKRRNGIDRKIYFCKIPIDSLSEVFSRNEEMTRNLKDRLKTIHNVVLKT